MIDVSSNAILPLFGNVFSDDWNGIFGDVPVTCSAELLSGVSCALVRSSKPVSGGSEILKILVGIEFTEH